MSEIVNKDRKELDEKGANIIADSVNKLAKSQEYVVLAVPGGRSVSGIFTRLKEKDIPWNKVHIFMVDERLVPIDHEESNFKLAKESFVADLIKQGKLPEQNIHPFIMDKEKETYGIGEYADELKQYGARYDIVLLSSGEDGHVGALYPNHSIKDDAEFYIVMHDSPKLPKDRMTMSRQLLLKSKVAIILFFGEAKKQAYNKFKDESVSVIECPAKIVNKIPESYILTDIK